MFPDADVAPASEKVPIEVKYMTSLMSHTGKNLDAMCGWRVPVTGDCGTAAAWK